MTDEYNKAGATVTIGHTKGIFSKLTTSLDDMKNKLKTLLSISSIIYDVTNFMTPDQKKEKESIERFIVFCKIHGYNYSLVLDNSSKTDIIVNGCKIQMKFSSNPQNTRRTYSYKIKARSPYKYGDNDYYVIELGTHKGKFLIIPEIELFDRGYLSYNNVVGKSNINVYPYDYIETRFKITPNGHKHRVKGNWTCNYNLWYDNERRPTFNTNNIVVTDEKILKSMVTIIINNNNNKATIIENNYTKAILPQITI